MKQVIIIHGPNLNLLGERQPEIYGKQTLGALNREITKYAKSLGFQATCFQTNSESEIIDLLQKHRKKVSGIIINPAGYSHTSVAILDALLAVEVPVVEVHLTNLYRREEFRQKSMTARGAIGVISGFGQYSYLLALQFLAEMDKG